MEARIPVGSSGTATLVGDGPLWLAIASSASLTTARDAALAPDPDRSDVASSRSQGTGGGERRPLDDEPGAELHGVQLHGMHSLTIHVESVVPGDLLAVAQRFYRVIAPVQMPDGDGFPLVMLKSLETGASAAIEFRNSTVPVSVLRLVDDESRKAEELGEAFLQAENATMIPSDSRLR